MAIGSRRDSASGDGTIRREHQILNHQVLEPGVFRVQPHPRVLVEALAGMRVTTSEVVVQERREVAPTVSVNGVAKPSQEVAGVHADNLDLVVG
ncbi:MAG: hypothetical protein ABIQ53_01260 [Terracoccus sp.]